MDGPSGGRGSREEHSSVSRHSGREAALPPASPALAKLPFSLTGTVSGSARWEHSETSTAAGHRAARTPPGRGSQVAGSAEAQQAAARGACSSSRTLTKPGSHCFPHTPTSSRPAVRAYAAGAVCSGAPSSECSRYSLLACTRSTAWSTCLSKIHFYLRESQRDRHLSPAGLG